MDEDCCDNGSYFCRSNFVLNAVIRQRISRQLQSLAPFFTLGSCCQNSLSVN